MLAITGIAFLAFATMGLVIENSARSRFPVVIARSRTQNLPLPSDSIDDSAIFINVNNIHKSLLISSDQETGIYIYNLSGDIVQHLTEPTINDIDIRYNFPYNGAKIALITAGNVTKNTIEFYIINESNNKMEKLKNGSLGAGLQLYGSCMYHDKRNKDFYIFANSTNGEVLQWQITSDAQDINLELVRSFNVGSQIEGCVADDRNGHLFLAQKDVGIWQYEADPDGRGRVSIDKVAPNGNLVGGVEGLALYRLRNGHGYLIASSQGDSSFAVYDRTEGTYLGKFQVKFKNNLVAFTRNIVITSQAFGSKFPNGLFLIQDGTESLLQGQNMKLVPVNRIATKFSPPLTLGVIDPEVERNF